MKHARVMVHGQVWDATQQNDQLLLAEQFYLTDLSP